jgi:hypothetical protein
VSLAQVALLQRSALAIGVWRSSFARVVAAADGALAPVVEKRVIDDDVGVLVNHLARKRPF